MQCVPLSISRQNIYPVARRGFSLPLKYSALHQLEALAEISGEVVAGGRDDHRFCQAAHRSELKHLPGFQNLLGQDDKTLQAERLVLQPVRHRLADVEVALPLSHAADDRFAQCEVGGFFWTVLVSDIVNSGREEQGSISM